MNIKRIGMNAAEDGLTKLTILVDGDRTNIAALVRQAKEKPFRLELKKITKTRSLDSNSYYQVLLEKLSHAIGISREELHRHMLSDYGTMKVRPDGKPIVFSLREDIDVNLIPCYTLMVGRGEINGQPYIHYAVLKGSHEMTSEEFSHLLDGLIQECKDQGIETATSQQLKEMMEAKDAFDNQHSTENKEKLPADLQEQIQWSSLDRTKWETIEVRD